MFLLLQITKEFGASATVRDYDGEFLLIEAALVLPSWMEPETAHNRVLIHDGRVHVIRPPTSPKEVGKYPSGKLSLEAALGHVRDSDLDTLAPRDVEAAIQKRLSGYPGKIAENTHRCRCFVPRKIAELLARAPSLIARAVESFYSRDPISSRVASKMERFDPATCVPVTVRFTRMTFAELVSQQFYPPKVFLPHVPQPTDPDHLAWQAGVKLACGFEMLAAEPRWRKMAEQYPDWTVETHDFEKDGQWLAFKRMLEARGYFGTEGADVNALERVAKEQYLLHSLPPSKPLGDPTEVVFNPGVLIAHLLSLPSLPDDALNREPADSEAWMTVEEDELEEMLQQRGASLSAEDLDATDRHDIVEPGSDDEEAGADSEGDEEDVEEEDSKELEKLRKLISGMSQFLDRDSGLDGVVFPGEKDDEAEENEDELERKFEELMDSDDEEGEPDVDLEGPEAKKRKAEPRLNPGRFAAAMRRTLNGERMADSDDESDEEEEGEADGQQGKGPGIAAYMDAMDAELAGTKLAEDFERVEPANGADSDEPRPVNLDLNLVKNILASFHAQEGLPGPATGLLAGLGVGGFKLPKEED